MEIISYNDGLLTNIEVIDILQEFKNIKAQRRSSVELQNRDVCKIETYCM